MWSFLEVFICGNKFCVSSTVISLISPKFCRLNCALLWDSLLLITSAKDTKSEVFTSLKKASGEFLARSQNISSKKGLQTHLGICANANVCALERTQERGNRLCFALFAWLVISPTAHFVCSYLYLKGD